MYVYEMINRLEEIRDNNEDGANLEVFVLNEDREATEILRLEVASLNDPDDPDAFSGPGPPVKGVGIHWL